MQWLDLARYADTHGYHIDSQRDMWTWRDWVIDAFNRNMPFDRFGIEQLAGDLLPNATLQQKLASGFNRNHMINYEGGAIPEEYQVEYVADRVDTTSNVFMGLTVGCARCHDHKYDPISQKELLPASSPSSTPSPRRDSTAAAATPRPSSKCPPPRRQARWRGCSNPSPTTKPRCRKKKPNRCSPPGARRASPPSPSRRATASSPSTPSKAISLIPPPTTATAKP